MSRHSKLVAAAKAVRDAMKSYYAYRPVSDMDLDRKAELLKASKQRERDLDQLLQDELKGTQRMF